MMNYETGVQSESDAYSNGGLTGDQPRKGWGKIIVIALILLALIVAALVAYLQLSGASDEPVAEEEAGSAVTVVAPGSGTIAGTIVANGTLAARRALPVGVAGEGGRVISVPVDAGDWVRQGQVLAIVDRSVQNQQAASASAQISVAQADANLAQANLDRALKLVERGFISKADIDRLTATRDAATARVRVAQAQSSELRARNARLSIIAPSSGLVLERNVEPGQIVSGGSGTLFLIAKGGEMEMMAELGETELAQISAGVSAEVTPVGGDKTFTGQVWQVSPTINPQNRQGIARIALSYSPELRPGGFASAVISSGTIVAPLLPESAIQSDDKGSYVYIVGKDNKVVVRRIKTGLVSAKGIAITSGLVGTEQVVLRAGGFLTPGEKIQPKLIERED